LQNLVFFVLKTIKTAAARKKEKPLWAVFVVSGKKYLKKYSVSKYQRHLSVQPVLQVLI
jgi:hypothetical protein